MKKTGFAIFSVVWFFVVFPNIGFSAEAPRAPLHISAKDFTTKTIGREMVEGHENTIIQAQARNWRLANALGYCRIKAWFDIEDRVTRKVILLDANDKKITTVRFLDFHQRNGITKARRMEVNDHRNGQVTVYELNNGQSPFTFM